MAMSDVRLPKWTVQLGVTMWNIEAGLPDMPLFPRSWESECLCELPFCQVFLPT
jgi:hypothetical protein